MGIVLIVHLQIKIDNIVIKYLKSTEGFSCLFKSKEKILDYLKKKMKGKKQLHCVQNAIIKFTEEKKILKKLKRKTLLYFIIKR